MRRGLRNRGSNGSSAERWRVGEKDPLESAGDFDSSLLLVTGGTGTFGNAVVDRFLKTDIREIRVFSRDELKQNDMRHQYHDPRLRFYIGDVRDYGSIRDAAERADYTSSNTERLSVDGLVELLLGLKYVQAELQGWTA